MSKKEILVRILSISLVFLGCLLLGLWVELLSSIAMGAGLGCIFSSILIYCMFKE